MCRLSVVVPVFQEAQRLPQTLPLLVKALDKLGVSSEVLLVVEPGQDDSPLVAARLAQRYGWRVILPDVHQGKGGAVRRGVLSAVGEIVCFMDADMSTDLSVLRLMLERFDADPQAQIVIGDRRDADSVIVHRQSLLRQSLGRLFNRFVRLLFPQIAVRDTQCGFKAFRAETAHTLFSRQSLNGFSFDVEVLLLAAQAGATVKTVPVRWADSGRSSVRLFRHGGQMAADLIRLRFNKNFLRR